MGPAKDTKEVPAEITLELSGKHHENGAANFLYLHTAGHRNLDGVVDIVDLCRLHRKIRDLSWWNIR